MKKILLTILLPIYSLQLFAQDENVIKNEVRLLAELKKETYDIDSNAKAVVLFKKAYLQIDRVGFNYTIEFAAKILSDAAASDLSNISIPKFDYGNVFSISAETYNLENGKITKQELDKDEIKKDNFTDGLNFFKFNLPSVKKGSVIHYKYKMIQPGFFYIPDYYLQEKYPILYQTYEIQKPNFIKFLNIERVNVPITRAQAQNQLDKCEAGYFTEGYGEEVKYEIWVRRNEPAFEEEPMMGSAINFKEKIRIQIKTLLLISYLEDWDFYNKRYIYDNNDYVGQVFKNNSFLSDKIDVLTTGKQTATEKAQAIYAFVRDSFNIKYTNKDFSLRTIFKDKVGTENEINLFLTSMLRKAGFIANPVFLSPKPGEKLNSVYPDNQSTKDIITAVKIDNKDVYLDATKKQLPFGVLLPEEYNGYARLIDEKSRGIELTPNDIQERSATMVNIKPGEKPNQLLIKLDTKFGIFEAYNFRKQMINDTAQIRKSIVKKLAEESGGITLTNLKIENLNNPDAALKIHLEAIMDLEENVATIYFDPFLDNFFDENPFPNTKRVYPIEMDYKEEKSYLLTMELPQGYVLDDFPKSIAYKLDQEGRMGFKNQYTHDTATNTLSLKSSFQISETNYPAAKYEDIRSFYGKVISEQNQKIVIKKKTS